AQPCAPRFVSGHGGQMRITMSTTAQISALLLAASLLAAGAAASAADGPSAYDFEFHAQASPLYASDGGPWRGVKLEEGQVVRLAEFEGRPVLVVNTAAHCGFTPQLEGLQVVYDKYRDQGLVMIGVQADDFAGQGGTEAELREKCEVYDVDFP